MSCFIRDPSWVQSADYIALLMEPPSGEINMEQYRGSTVDKEESRIWAIEYRAHNSEIGQSWLMKRYDKKKWSELYFWIQGDPEPLALSNLEYVGRAALT